MDEEEKQKEKRADANEDAKATNTLRDTFSKENKSKYNLTFIKNRFIKAAIKVAVITAIIAAFLWFSIIAGILKLIEDDWDTETNYSAGNATIKNNSTIAQADDNEYYYKVDKKILQQYLEELDKANQKGLNSRYSEGELEDADDFDATYEYDEETAVITKDDIAELFHVRKFEDCEKYLIKMITAEIASAYPKLGTYTGIDKPGDTENKVDKDGNYVVQGVAEIRRTMMEEDGTVDDTIELKYIPKSTMESMIAAGDTGVLNYFSFEMETNTLYYVTWSETLIDGVSQGIELQMNQVDYNKYTNMCSMPFNFLYALLQKSENPEYIMKVADLVLKSKNFDLKIMIQDKIQQTTTDTTYVIAQKEGHTEVSAVYAGTRTETGTRKNETTGEEETYEYSVDVYEWAEAGEIQPDAGSEPTIANERFEEVITYDDTAVLYVEKAHTWCIDYEQIATLKKEEFPKEQIIDPADVDLNAYPYSEVSRSGPEGEPSSASDTGTVTAIFQTEEIPYDQTRQILKYSWQITDSVPKEINYSKFLGLWKNKDGEYSVGCEFDPDGKKVPYKMPLDDKAKSYPPDTISELNNQKIDALLDLLELSEDLEAHEALMKYFWNKYIGKDVYDIDEDTVLNVFNKQSFSSTSSYHTGSSNEDKVWWTLIDAGLSTEAAAGVMGNIYRECGFQPNLVEAGKLGMTAEQYTAAVDDGTYTREQFMHDSAGYGLIQWTWWSNKGNLYDYAKIDRNTSIGDIDMQIDALLITMGLKEPTAHMGPAGMVRNGYTRDRLINATTPEEAAVAFERYYEGSGDWDGDWNNDGSPDRDGRRQQYAREFYEKYKNAERPQFSSDVIEAGRFIFPNYKQDDPIWSSRAYGSSTIGAAACGPTSLSICLSGLLGDPTITPVTYIENLEREYPDWRTYYIPGEGSTGVVLSAGFIEKYYSGIQVIASVTEASGIQALEEGNAAILGHERGHFLAIVPVTSAERAQGYKFRIIDPSTGKTRRRDGLYKSLAEATAAANVYGNGPVSFTEILKLKDPSSYNGWQGNTTSDSLSKPLTSTKVNSKFGYRSSSATNGVGSTNHKGVDLYAVENTPVYASADGTVTEASTNASRGKYVIVDHGNGLSTLYQHCNSLVVSKGQSVKRGQLIAYSGNTGASTGAHLHFEVWENGTPVDPEKYINFN